MPPGISEYWASLSRYGVCGLSAHIHWSRLLSRLSADQRRRKNLFARSDNHNQLLGRLYGFVHAQSEGIGLNDRKRHRFTRELLQELLLLGDLQPRLQVLVQHDNHDFFQGWQEGKLAGQPAKGSINEDDREFERFLDQWQAGK